MENPAVGSKSFKDVCKVMYSTLGYIIKTYTRLHATFQSWRPANDDNDLSKNVMKSLEESVANVVAGKTIVKRAYKIFSSKNMDENQWKAFSHFWNQLSTYLDDNQNLIVKSAVELMRQEIEHIWLFQGLFNICQLYPPRPKTISFQEYKRMQVLWHYNHCLTNFTTISYLFLDLLPQRLPPNLFFSNADAVYFFVSSFFEPIVVQGKKSDFPFLYKLSCSFVQMGNMCPKSKLEFPRPQDAEFAVKQRTGLFSISPRKRFNITLLSRLKVVRERFNNYSISLGNKLLEDIWVSFFGRYHVLELYDAVMKDAIKKIKSVYIQMRRIVCFNFLQIFPPQELYDHIQKLLQSGMQLYFNDCIELLKLCQKSIENVKKRAIDLEYETRQAYRKVYVPYRTLHHVLPGICKEAVIDFIRLFYKGIRAKLPSQTAKYIVAFGAICAKRGCNPTMYQQARDYFVRGINTFMCMRAELDTAINECGDSTLVILDFEDRARAPELLRKYFVSACKKVPQLQHQAFETKSILRLLPLNEELRKAIAKEMGAMFDGTEPEIPPNPAPKKPFFGKRTIDMKSYVPLPQDILTNQQLNIFFKLARK